MNVIFLHIQSSGNINGKLGIEISLGVSECLAFLGQ
jgi:hypothetical protein